MFFKYDECWIADVAPDGCVLAAGVDELPHGDGHLGRGLKVGHGLGAGAEVCAELLPHTPANVVT